MMSDLDYKQLVESLLNPNTSKEDCNFAWNKIDDKILEIWTYIFEITNKKMGWWDHDFDPSIDYIYIECDYTDQEILCDEKGKAILADGFPTSYLWEDYKKLAQKEVNNALLAVAQKKLKLKECKTRKKQHEKDLSISIYGKISKILTEEELKYMKRKLG
jgi:hypothetical protein